MLEADDNSNTTDDKIGKGLGLFKKIIFFIPITCNSWHPFDVNEIFGESNVKEKHVKSNERSTLIL